MNSPVLLVPLIVGVAPGQEPGAPPQAPVAPPVAPATVPAVQRLAPSLDRVTIYGGQALVERTFACSAEEPGPVDLVLGPFPRGAHPDSFQTKVEEGPARFTDLEVRTETGLALDSPERERLRQRLADLRDQRRALDTDLSAIEAGQKLVQAVIAAIGAGQPTSGASGVGTEITVANLYDFVRQRSRELDRDRAAYQKAVQDLEQQIADVEHKLGQAEGALSRRYQEVRVSLFFERAGAARLRLTYLVDGARWLPTYEVRVAPDLTGVTVALVAEVRQRSGEDWEDAQLWLSTSMPSIGLDPPAIPLRVFELPRPQAEQARRRLETLDHGDERGSRGRPAAGAEVAGKSADAFEPAPEVAVQDYGITTQFQLPQRKTVRANDEPHRFILREVPLDVRAERYVVPSRSDKAFLHAEVTLSGDAPLLAGRAKVFLGPDYLGQASFPTLRPGDSTTVNLGIDPNLAVTCETVVDERDDPGFLASTVRITRVYRCTLKLSAAAPGPVQVLVEDAIPISRTSEVEVTPTQLQPAPEADPDSKRLQAEQGRYRWRVSLAPGQTQHVRWGYVVGFDEALEPLLNELEREPSE